MCLITQETAPAKTYNISDTLCGQKVTGHTGAAVVTSFAGQLQIFDWSVSNNAGHTVLLFAKSWVPGMGMAALFLGPLHMWADVWASGMLIKVRQLQQVYIQNFKWVQKRSY